MASNVMCPLKSMPTKPTKYDFNAPYYLIWQERKSYLEDDRPWKCVAVFMFLPDALDFIAKCQDEGTAVCFQSPAESRLVTPDERRVVCKIDPVTV